MGRVVTKTGWKVNKNLLTLIEKAHTKETFYLQLEELEKAIFCTERQMPVLLQTHSGEHSHWNYSSRQCQSKPKIAALLSPLLSTIFFTHFLGSVNGGHGWQKVSV